MNRKDCAVIILAAGNSLRMGRPKFTLTLPNGTTFLENILNQYSDFGCMEIVVVLNHEGIDLIKDRSINIPSRIQIVLNPYTEFGRFYSLKTGIKLITNNFAFIHNVDNPYAKKEVLDQMYDAKNEADVIKPINNSKGGHPVLISKQVMNYILQEKKHNINFKEVLKMFRTKKVEVQDESILLNINTYDEYLEFYRK